MKRFVFDCWGPGMSFVEELQNCAAPNTAFVSHATFTLVDNMGLKFLDSSSNLQVS